MLSAAQDCEWTEEVVDWTTAAVKDHYNRIAHSYDREELLSERRLGPWREGLWAHAAGRILEVGVGTGRNFPHYPAGAKVTAVDVADQMLVRARVRASRLGIAVDLREGDVQALDFADSSFDTAVATFVFSSVPDPARGLRELARVVKPDGRILLLEHVRVNRPIIAWVMALLMPVTVSAAGARIDRSAAETAQHVGLEVEFIERGFLDPLRLAELIVARPGEPAAGMSPHHTAQQPRDLPPASCIPA